MRVIVRAGVVVIPAQSREYNMPRHDESDTNMQAQYNVTAERIIQDVRGADSLIVLAVKDGKPQLWATDKPDKAQDFAAQYLGSSVTLPEPAFMAGAGSTDR
jgi:hypothetical protein